MLPNFSKSSVTGNAKSTKLLFILTLYAAAAIDWDALRAIWAAAVENGKLTALPLLTGTGIDSTAHTLECKSGSVSFSVAPGEAPQDGVATVSGVLDGVAEDQLKTAYALQGEEVVAIVERCSDGKKFIFANPCTGGVTFQYQSIGAQDGGEAGVAFNLTGKDCPVPVLIFEEEVTTS